ncbi:MAG: septum formation protein Maf [Clostridia bacterium]|nr:septum formation protein Maf [Clostridia bacterium]
MKIILASKSPRRRELLGKIYPEFDIISAEADETLPAGIHPRDGVRVLAERKGRAVLNDVPDDALVISSDTLVEADGIPFGKPEDEADARRMLKLLSGRDHFVHTGVAVHYLGRVYSGTDSTRVRFKHLTDGEILSYIALGEPMDKAGAYAIQGEGGKFVSEYEGAFDTVVGLSTELLKKLIKAALENDKE